MPADKIPLDIRALSRADYSATKNAGRQSKVENFTQCFCQGAPPSFSDRVAAVAVTCDLHMSPGYHSCIANNSTDGSAVQLSYTKIPETNTEIPLSIV
jgi:hypothetical protein